MRTPTKETFLRDVAVHEMDVMCDSGIHRHITFSRDGSSVYRFHITTWPGYLAISGDMGTFVFARPRDMFEFFRGDGINLGYWAEKLHATERHGGHREFSIDLYRAALRDDFRGWRFDNWRQMRAAWREVTDEIWEPDNLHDAIGEALRYRCSVTGNDFQDFWDHMLEDYTYRYVWCCYAIQWAIGRYDASLAAPANDNTQTETTDGSTKAA
jgi:hypothetical protein